MMMMKTDAVPSLNCVHIDSAKEKLNEMTMRRSSCNESSNFQVHLLVDEFMRLC